MTISAIVPVCNGRALLARLLASLEAQTLRASEVLVIDNGSTDGAPELALSQGARVIAMGSNTGFARAVNRGIREAAHPLVAILNSDVELAPDYLATLANSLTANRAPFATGMILSPTGSLDGTFDLTCLGAATWRAGAGHPDGPPFDEPRSIASPPWTAVLYRAELFREIGGLEEALESYLEDVEFGMRCAARGILGRYEPAARAIHLGSATLGRWHPDTVRRIARNQVLLAERYRSACPRGTVMVAQALWGLVAARHGHPIAWLQGVIQGIQAWQGKAGSVLPPLAMSSVDSERLELALVANERFIRANSTNSYWRLYFLLTGGAK